MTSVLGPVPLPSASRRFQRLRKPPAIIFPHNARREYQRAIRRLVEPALELVRSKLLPEIPSLVAQAGMRRDDVRLDVYADQLERTMNGVVLEYERRVPGASADAAAADAAGATSSHNRVQVNRQVKSVLGVDVMQAEPWLDQALGGWARENALLIRSIPSKHFADVEQLVLRGIRSGQRAEAIAEQIEQRFKVASNRAALIAQDQIGKLNGQLTSARHQDVGLRRYRWRNSRDERVRGNPGGKYPDARPSHHHREGQIYSYDKPPEGGHPGEPIRCRCWAEPVFEDLLGDDFGVDLTPAPVATQATATKEKIHRRLVAPSTVLRDDMTLEDSEDAIRGRRVEHLGVFDGNGRLVHTTVGTSDSVGIPPAAAQLAKRRGDVTMTHNHPVGYTFSPQDLAEAVRNNLREIRAVTNRGVWIARRPAAGWGGRWRGRALVDSLTRAYYTGWDRGQRRFDELMADGRRQRMSQGRKRELKIETANAEIRRAYEEWGAAYGWRIEFEPRSKQRR